MPQFRPPPATGADRAAAAGLLADALAERRVSTTPGDLVSDVGGTRRAAGLLGVSQRTVQRRVAGQGPGLSAGELRVLAQGGAAARVSRVVDQLGGVKRVAELTGRDPSTVRRWASGKIHSPKPDARMVLGRADAALRMGEKGLQIDPATGRPRAPLSVQMRADVRVRGASKSLSADTPNKFIGGWGGVNLPDDVVIAVVEALGAGDTNGVKQALEEYLSTNYAACSSYDPANEIGFFLDRIHSVSFEQD
jgi:DNA-binding transcriptional regulator YdaS (Cro superfamily)